MHIVEHLSHRFAINHLIDFVVVFIHIDVHGIGVAKQVVHIAENFLVGTHQKHAEIVAFSLTEAVHRQRMRDAMGGGEVGYFAIAIASDVLQGGTVGGPLIEA